MAWDNTAGIVATTNPHRLLLGPEGGRRLAQLVTLYNPNATITEFVLRLYRPSDQFFQMDRTFIRWDDGIPITDSWILGGLVRPAFVVMPRQRFEIVLDAEPTLPIEYVIDFQDLP